MNTEKRIVGRINFDEYLNEVNIDAKELFPRFDSINGLCTIEVYGNEGNRIPHFHINSVKQDKKDKFSCCIYLFDNRYFDHGDHMDKLKKKDCKTLDNWMRSSNTNLPVLTNWEVAIAMWRDLNDKNHYTDNTKIFNDMQPDYTYIKPYKE